MRNNAHLQISSLAHYPFLNELLRILGKAQEKLSVDFQLIDCINLKYAQSLIINIVLATNFNVKCDLLFREF